MNKRLADTDNSNWRRGPHSRWSYQHVGEILPTALICRNLAGKTPFAISKIEIEEIDLPGPDGKWTISEMHEQSYTDSLLILHNGKIVHRWHGDHVDPSLPHIVFSISKSITACIAGILASKGIIDTSALVPAYLPGVKAGAYLDCTVQHVLDMSVALDFDEDYAEPEGDYMRYRNASGWNPVDQNNPGPDLEPYLYSLQKLDEPHGEVFRYRSPNSDLLALILERAANAPFANLISEHLWCPMGAQCDAGVTVDRNGLARGAGGICVTIDDLARLGQLIVDQGKASNGNQVLPVGWIEDTLNGGNRDAWCKGSMAYLLPQGNYRNKWYQSGNNDEVMWAMGIHGQYLYVNPRQSIVIAKQSSQPLPINDPIEMAVMASIESLAQTIAI